MKKTLVAAGIFIVMMTACNSNTDKTTETTESTESVSPDRLQITEAQQREKEINDSTKMLDKKLKDPNSTYSPDSLK